MDKKLAALILFGILFVSIFIIDYLFIKRRYLNKIRKNKKRKKDELTEISYLVGKFKLDKNQLPLNKILIIISLINAFIISLVAVVVLLLNTNIILELIVGFILLIALIYAIYEIYGRYLESRYKNGK